jgi:tetratricopeptide (TPR) repeat protein
MTEKGKKTDQKAGHARHVPAEEGAGAGAELSSHPRKVSGHGPKALPYRKDANYHKLLAHFQRAEWAECLESIDHLLKAHPGDEHLLAFKHDVQLRSEHQEHSEKQRESDDQRRRRKGRRRAVIAALCGTIVLILVVWFISSYRAEETRKRLSAEATQTAQALAVQDETADILMKAGKPEQALALYEQIQSVDPSYDGVEEAIQAAQLGMRVEDLYQQGTAAMQDGDKERALELLGNVEELAPEYKDTSQLVAKINQDLKIDSLLEAIDEAYNRGDSAAVIEHYEEIQILNCQSWTTNCS